MDERDPLFGGNNEAKRRRSRKQSQYNKLCGLLAIVAILAVVAAVVAVVVTRNKSSSSPSGLPAAVTTENIRKHLESLQEIANKNTRTSIPSRSVLDNYNDSAEFVFRTLAEKGFDVTRQFFRIPVNHEYTGNYLRTTFQDIEFDFQEGVEFNVMRYSGNGTVTAPMALPNDPVGCSDAAFSEFPAGSIALLEYTGNCSYYEMAMRAANFSASAVIIAYGEQYKGLAPSRSRIVGPNVYTDPVAEHPVLSGSYALYTRLHGMLAAGPLTVSLFANTSIVWAETYNVLATMPRGNPGTTIVVGSHLDSVPAGPGINDNGSGSSVNLELALQFASLNSQPVNKVLFAWWGAEELGLLGSKFFVRTLTEAGRKNISLNLNMDMVASPNYYRGVYNGTSAHPAISTQSETIKQLLQESFCKKNLPHEIIPFTGRSDYGPFIDEDVLIPAGAIATGADGSKTMEERRVFGGFANVPYDTCYHARCDTIDNIDTAVLGDMAETMANALQVLMMEENLPEYLMQSTPSYQESVSCVLSGASIIVPSSGSGT